MASTNKQNKNKQKPQPGKKVSSGNWHDFHEFIVNKHFFIFEFLIRVAQFNVRQLKCFSSLFNNF